MNIFSKSTREKLYSKLSEKQNLRKVAKLFYVFLTTLEKVENYMQWNTSDNCVHYYDIEILNLFYLELELINTKPIIKNKLKEFLSELKMFKAEKTLIFVYKKGNDFNIFHSRTISFSYELLIIPIFSCYFLISIRSFCFTFCVFL